MKLDGVIPAKFGYALRLVWASSPGWTLASVGSVALQAALTLAALALFKLLIDAVAASLAAPHLSSTVGHVAVLIGLVAAVGLLTSACTSVDGAIGEIHRDLVSDHIQGVVHAKAGEMDLGYYENAQFRDTLHRVQSEAPNRATTVLTSVLQAARGGIFLTAIAGLLFTFNWWVALILVIGDLPGAIVRIRNAWAQYQWDRQRTPIERQASYYNILLGGHYFVQEIRLFDLGGLFAGRFRVLRQQLRDDRKQLVRKRMSVEIAAHVFSALAMFGAYSIVVYHAIAGTISIGAVVMYYAAFQRGHGYLHELLFGLARFYENSLFLTDLSDFLALKNKIAEPVEPRPVPRSLCAGITVEHVNFRYPGSDHLTLRDVSLVARPGERIAIVGANGSGKSTLVKLLCRLYDPSAGRIAVDGIPLTALGKKAWWSEISVFFQDHGKYYLTARENIRFGRKEPMIDDTPIIEAARRSGADEVIGRLRRKYDTVLGTMLEQGAELSVGEWQKVALARTDLRKALVTILDEPTNAMDALSEQKALDAMWTVAPDRVTILISHRLSSVRCADRIYVLAGGCIVETGTHDELMGLGGNYATLFAAQAQNYK